MPRQIVAVDPTFGQRLKELREQRGLSLRRLGQRVHCSHGYLWDLEAGGKRPSLSVVTLLDAALDAGGQLSALVRTVSADSGGQLAPSAEPVGVPGAGLEFASDWRHGVVAATTLWREDMQRRDLLVGTGFNATLFLTPALRWLTTRLDERPAMDGDRLVGAPDVETVRQITNVYRILDNQYGGAHVRDGLVRFLNTDVAPMLQGRYDARTGTALFSAAAEATQLAGWASYDVGMHGLAQRYLVQALRLAAAAGDQPLGAEILAAMSHQAAYLGASVEAVDLARAAGRTAAEAGVGAIQAESAVLEAQGHAVGGDEAACADALDRAERAFDRADRTSAPQWIGYFDESYLAAKFGHCFSALGRGELAVRFASRSLQMDGRRFARGRQFNLALLAVAHAQSGEFEQASSVGVQAVEAAEGLGSVRSRDYLAALAARLAPHVGLPAVREFSERARPVLQAA
ncbi:helix-turn-helix transcriptional regulator [Solwaraspora sp. WMMD1047]|uniref:helix-turn-helix domain-containing protein n=1 Tax=Solwaraspora sp. WMMD1047 TaxID=3016102 RepID=UPI002415D372|nr:helix-turn-helix transcriptional regulator [Solwaraspora sp. WMMD1047]MDG4829267.1 helix-turn-helix transcriptional regulator [Solwaraspora sp. WMMD1047]